MMRCITKRLVVACMVFLLVAISILWVSHSLVEMVVTCVLDSVGVAIAVVELLLSFLLGVVKKESKKKAKSRIKLSEVRTVYDLDKEDKKETENVSEFFPHVVDNDRKRVPRNIPKSVWEVRWVLRRGEYRKDLSGHYILDDKADKVLFEVWKYILVQGMFTYRYSPVRETPGTSAYWRSTIDKDVEIKEAKDLEKGAATGTIISYDPLSTAKHKNTRVRLDKRDGQKEAVEKNFRFGDVELFEAFRALGVIGLGSSIVGLRVYVTSLNGYCYIQKLVDGVRLPEGILNIDNACPLFIRAKGYWKLQYGITEREELVADGVVYYRSEKYGYKYQLGHVLSLDRVADYKKKNIKRKLGTKRAAAKQAALNEDSGGTEVYDLATDVEYYKDNRVTVKIDGESEPRVVWLIGGYAKHMDSIVPGGCLRVVVIGNIAFIDEREDNGDILLIPELSVGELEDNRLFERQDRLQLTLQEEGVGEERKLADPFPVIEYDLGVGEDSEDKLE